MMIFMFFGIRPDPDLDKELQGFWRNPESRKVFSLFYNFQQNILASICLDPWIDPIFRESHAGNGHFHVFQYPSRPHFGQGIIRFLEKS